MEAETLKRKHSEGEIKTSEIKKTKTDEELKLDDKKTISFDDDKGDDLLKRLEAIEQSSGPADLKLDEIETNEKDDLLNRLEEAELGDISFTKEKIIVSEDKKEENIVLTEKVILDDTLDISTDILILDSTIDESVTSSSQNKNVNKMDVEQAKSTDENITKVIEQSSINSEDGNLHRQATAVIGDIEKMEISDDELKVTTSIDKTLSDTRSLGGTTDDEVIIKFVSETNIPDDKPEKEITVSIDTIIRDKLNSKTPMMMNNGSSTPNSNNTSASAVNHMFNSTPIQKLTKMKAESESLLSNLTESTEIITETTDEDHICSSSAETSSQQTSGDSLDKFANVIKKYNGITAATDDEKSSEKSKKIDCVTPDNNTTGLSLANGSSMEISNCEDEIYEITLAYEDNDMKYLCVEKTDKIKKHGRATPLTDFGGGTDSSGKRSSNGSVGSIGPFALPAQRSSVMSSSASSSLGSQKTEDGKFAIPAQPQKTRHTVKGLSALCTFFIDHFTKVKQSLNNDDSNATENDGTPRGKGRPTVKKTLLKNESPDVTEKTKKKKKDDLNESLDPPGQCVLARWVDKKYYAGQVTASKPGNKFVILFQDGASKTLPADSIVFGTNDILPLIDQSIHARVSDETYEPGLVTMFKTDEFSNIIYTVITESGTIDVTASDIYLDEDQAKMINGVFKEDASTPAGKRSRTTSKTDEILSGPRSTRGKRTDKNIPNTEAGCSGIIAKGKKGRAKKIVSNVSESSDISDTMEDSAPNSPDSALEAVDGVQPELQKTPREAELNKMSLIAEYLGNDKTKDFDDILGPIPTNKSLFKNKHFIITCTIPMKEPRTEIKEDDLELMTNKHKKFTTTPFVKQHIIKQIESGGGKVYNHFEEIPKNKYNQCKLIAPHPCITAKYVQCLACDIQAVSHEWIVESCQKGSVSPYKNFILPSGWSILDEKYIKWAIGRTNDHRANAKPLSGQVVLMASQNHDFSEFWSRVCKQAGATIRLIKTQNDITETQSGFMLSDDEFPQEIKSKADHYGIPIVSSVWVVQSLIVGKALEPNAHEKLKQIYVDDDY